MPSYYWKDPPDCSYILSRYSWLVPLVWAVREGASGIREVRELLGCNSRLAKSLIHYGLRLGVLGPGMELAACRVNPPVYRVLSRYLAIDKSYLVYCRVTRKKVRCSRTAWKGFHTIIRAGPRDLKGGLKGVLTVIGQPFR